MNLFRSVISSEAAAAIVDVRLKSARAYVRLKVELMFKALRKWFVLLL